MSARLRDCSSYRRIGLDAGWQLCAAGPGELADASALHASSVQWVAAAVPGTVADSLRAAGSWSLAGPARRFDAQDWWYRVRFSAQPAAPGERVLLGFDGLASVTQVWLNGQLLLQSDSMFLAHHCDVGTRLRADNELVLCFRAIDALLKPRRPRPRWRVPMLEQQQLRWIRTSLLGRTPGWSPPAPPVGPWRAIWLQRRRVLDLSELRLQVSVEDDSDAASGAAVQVSCRVAPLGGARLRSATLSLQRDGQQHEVALREVQEHASRPAGALLLQGRLRLPRVARWWPHTHGEPALYRAQLQFTASQAGESARGALGGAEDTRVDVALAEVGFRTVRLRREGGDFALALNGCDIFARGACWMPLDAVSLQGSAQQYERAFAQVRDAGMNMLRISGASVYEHDRFLDLCDRHGILLWQDFMFANMDYPGEDPGFMAAVRAEVCQQLLRLQGRPAAAILCGNSEVSQQAAMAGAAREDWYPPLFERELAALAGQLCPDVPYCPSSTHGGAYPHQVADGTTSYYGVGAYLRPLDDARRSQLRFASECLAFANVPEQPMLEQIASGLRVHDARWKQRVPRDLSAGWDFDDVRDHYLGALFGCEPQRLRYAQHERYLALSRVVSGEVMAAAFAEWRRGGSSCHGALVWFLRDLWPGAGWGVIDASGEPKAAYYYLRRVLQPLAVLISDEGNNGLQLHLVNDHQDARAVRLQLQLFRDSQPVGDAAVRSLELAARSVVCLPATDLFEGFVDLSYAFRFGPPWYDLLHVQLQPGPGDAAASAGAPALAEAFYFPLGLARPVEADVGLSATCAPVTATQNVLTISARRFAQSVHIAAPSGWQAEEQYFHLAPATSRSVRLMLPDDTRDPHPVVRVSALNCATVCRALPG